MDYHGTAGPARDIVLRELNGSLAAPEIWRKKGRMSNTLELKIKTCRNMWRLSRVKNMPWTPSWCRLPELKQSEVEVLPGEFGYWHGKVLLVLGRRRPGKLTDTRDMVNPAVERVTEVRDQEGTLRNQNVRTLECRTSLIRNK
jgi:hypothetical protein